ncbi:MAG TPA: ABC transporter permease [Planctomycetota bacterium]|jgi:ABC-type polysaccharide/polyol phosphate export permease
MNVIGEIKNLCAFREVLRNLVSTDLKLRFRRSLLGYGWSLLYPIMTMVILATVFFKFMRFGNWKEMVPYIFAGLVPWNFFVSSCLSGGNAILGNEALLKKIYLPKLVFPLSVLFARFVDFLFNLAALFVIVSLIAFKPSWALLALPGAILVLVLFVEGVVVAVSAINVYVRDTSHLMSIVLQLAFYLTPILYREDMPEVAVIRPWLQFNPMVHIVRLFQAILSDGRCPTSEQWGMAAAVAVVSVGLGHYIFKRLERNLIFRL